jgi:L-threonylcarbamoyladenylate synthase
MPVEVQRLNDQQDPTALIGRAAAALDAGELVVLPTETVYGAAGRLDKPAAVAKLRKMRRDATGPFTIHLATPDGVDALIGTLSPLARRMTQKLWPGPVAIVFDVAAGQRAKFAKRLKLTEADLFIDGTMTLRCPDHSAATAVLAKAGGVVAMARVETNFSGEPFDSVSLSHLEAGGVSLVIDAGRTRFAKPSTIVRLEGDSYRVVREGVFDERIIKRQLETMILFVCSGNTCRSPMAGALATRILRNRYGVNGNADLDAAGIRVVSAGTFAMPGLRATPQAVDAVADLGGDLTTHRSRQLTPELIHAADFIFTMGKSHAESTIAMSPSAAARVMPLDPARDVEDPIGSDVSTYRELAGHFVPLIESRFEQTVFKLHPPHPSQSSSEAKK